MAQLRRHSVCSAYSTKLYFQSGVTDKSLYVFVNFPLQTTSLAHRSLLDLATRSILGENRREQSCNYFYFNQLMHKYLSTLSLCIKFTITCFDISGSSSGSLKNLSLAKFHKFLELRLLKLQFLEIIRLKYIKTIFGRRRVIRCVLCDVIIFCPSRVFLWLHI